MVKNSSSMLSFVDFFRQILIGLLRCEIYIYVIINRSFYENPLNMITGSKVIYAVMGLLLILTVFLPFIIGIIIQYNIAPQQLYLTSSSNESGIIKVSYH